MNKPKIVTSKTGTVYIVRKRIREHGTMTIDSAGVTIKEKGLITLKLSFSDIKRIRLTSDGMLIYPNQGKGFTTVDYDLLEGDHLKNGAEILEWEQVVKQSPIRVKTISWVIVTCYSIIFLLAFGFILKLLVFPILALIIAIHYKIASSKN